MSYLSKVFTVSILSCLTFSVMAQDSSTTPTIAAVNTTPGPSPSSTEQTLPPSIESRCVCMPGNATGVLLKPGAMGVSSGTLESCPCVPKSKPETKESDSADGSTGEKTPSTSEGNTENTTTDSTSTNPGTVPDAGGNSSSESSTPSE